MSPAPPEGATGGEDRFVVAVAKGNLARSFVTSLLGVVGCVFLLTVTPANPTPVDSFIHVTAWIGIAFCGLTAFYSGRRLFDLTPGLVLDAEGIIDRSNLIGAGRVRWDEIREIRVTRSGRQRFLTVVVEDPEKFIRRGHAVRRRAAAANHRAAGSPVNITGRTLGIRFDELVAKTSEYYRRYGRPR